MSSSQGGWANDSYCYSNLIKLTSVISRKYERLSKLSGLVLNADKTEIMRLKKRQGPDGRSNEKSIMYLNKRYTIKLCQVTKINGILFQLDTKRMVDQNVAQCIDRMESNFKRWSQRRLSVLGKILIAKCFGISQMIYLMQSLVINNDHIKRINACVYKFIWNKHYSGAKAPERVCRAIVNTPIRLGGFGMLDICKLDDSLKLRSLGRLLTSTHPGLSIIKEQLNLEEFFFPTVLTDLDLVTKRSTELLKADRQALWDKFDEVEGRRNILSAIVNLRINRVVNATGKNSLMYFNIIRNGKRFVKDLLLNELNTLTRFIDKRLVSLCRQAIAVNHGLTEVRQDLYPNGLELRELGGLSSKMIRTYRDRTDPCCLFKCGLVMSPNETLNYMDKVRRLTSVRHRNIILRCLHGDIYTNERMARFGMREDPVCNFCDQIDTLDHRLTPCQRTLDLINAVEVRTRSLRTISSEIINWEPITKVMAAYNDVDQVTLSIHAEILMIIVSTRNVPLHEAVERTITLLLKRERNKSLKNILRTLLR